MIIIDEVNSLEHFVKVKANIAPFLRIPSHFPSPSPSPLHNHAYLGSQ